MTYTPPLSQAALNKGQKKFMVFAICFVVGLGLYWLFFLLAGHSWSGGWVWSLGAYLVLSSVIHAKYFDIMKVSNPNNLLIDPYTLTKSRPLFLIESIVRAAWILGFILTALERWYLK